MGTNDTGNMSRSDAMGEDYRIVSVEPVEAPGDLGGNNWHRYVIDQGANHQWQFADMATVYRDRIYADSDIFRRAIVEPPRP